MLDEALADAIKIAGDSFANSVSTPVNQTAFFSRHKNAWNIAYFDALGAHNPDLKQLIETEDVHAQRGLIDALKIEITKTEAEGEAKLRELDASPHIRAKIEKQIDKLVAMDAINEHEGISNALLRPFSMAKEGDDKTRAAVLLAMAIPGSVAGYATYKVRNPKPKPEYFTERAEQAQTAEHFTSKT